MSVFGPFLTVSGAAFRHQGYPSVMQKERIPDLDPHLMKRGPLLLEYLPVLSRETKA
jgi:hypothetical protein